MALLFDFFDIEGELLHGTNDRSVEMSVCDFKRLSNRYATRIKLVDAFPIVLSE